jgi:hypothetical protein
MQVFPIVELHLGGYGLEGEAEFGAEIEGPDGDLTVEVAKFSEGAVGPADGFPLGALHGVAQNAARAEEEGKGLEVGAKLLLAKLGDVLGEGVEVEKLLDVKGVSGGGRVIHGRLLALKHPG